MPRDEFDAPDFLEQLRRGDENAYRKLVRRFHGSLVGLAASVIGSRAQAEEVVQDAWLAVFAGIRGFEGRSTLATWLFSIVLNRARTRASRERRLIGLALLADELHAPERAVDLAAFHSDGHWREAPRLWDELSPERVVAGRQLWAHVQDCLGRMPAGQRAVLILRDIEGCPAEEACALLEISSENQRVLLHRARGRVRKAIDGLIAVEPRAGAASPEHRARGRPLNSPGSTIVRLIEESGMLIAGRIVPLVRFVPGIPRACNGILVPLIAGEGKLWLIRRRST